MVDEILLSLYFSFSHFLHYTITLNYVRACLRLEMRASSHFAHLITTLRTVPSFIRTTLTPFLAAFNCWPSMAKR